jgi:hypothetical protein
MDARWRLGQADKRVEVLIAALWTGHGCIFWQCCGLHSEVLKRDGGVWLVYDALVAHWWRIGGALVAHWWRIGGALVQALGRGARVRENGRLSPFSTEEDGERF